MFDSATLGRIEVRQEVNGLSHGGARRQGEDLARESYSSQGYRIFAADCRSEMRGARANVPLMRSLSLNSFKVKILLHLVDAELTIGHNIAFLDSLHLKGRMTVRPFQLS